MGELARSSDALCPSFAVIGLFDRYFRAMNALTSSTLSQWQCVDARELFELFAASALLSL